MSTPTIRRPARALGFAAAGALCAAVLAACGTSAATGTTATAPDSTPMSSMPMSPGTSMGSHMDDTNGMKGMKGMIMIEDFTFSTPKSVAPGATVMVMNMDSETHTLTADSGDAFDLTIPPGKTAELTAPDKPGSYPFHCQYHSNMHGTLRVR
jgi:plastocyanin